jgi:hypothetical protein
VHDDAARKPSSDTFDRLDDELEHATERELEDTRVISLFHAAATST